MGEILALVYMVDIIHHHMLEVEEEWVHMFDGEAHMGVVVGARRV